MPSVDFGAGGENCPAGIGATRGVPYDLDLGYFKILFKARRRGNKLGGRLEAAQSADYVLHVLFDLKRQWRPCGSRLIFHLDKLAGQSWQAGEVQAMPRIKRGRGKHDCWSRNPREYADSQR